MEEDVSEDLLDRWMSEVGNNEPLPSNFTTPAQIAWPVPGQVGRDESMVRSCPRLACPPACPPDPPCNRPRPAAHPVHPAQAAARRPGR